jgi:AraC family transcriptional regulator
VCRDARSRIYRCENRNAMTSYLKKIDESNKLAMNKPLNSDVIYYSELKQWYTANAFRSFGIKYVVDGCIYYKTGGVELPVTAGQYMVTCQNSNAKAYFETGTPVKSICIDICPETVAEIFTVLSTRSVDMENYLAGYFRYPQFYENISHTTATTLGARLQHLRHCILQHDDHRINKEWFLELAECIIYQEYGTFRSLNDIQSIRLSTRKEILRRLKLAHEFIQENFLQISEIRQVALHCSMSEYHFFRCFKQVYKKTPHQCIHERKMELAKRLLQEPQYKVADVAMMCSFPDIFTFSKAFKRFYGINPSAVKSKLCV